MEILPQSSMETIIFAFSVILKEKTYCPEPSIKFLSLVKTSAVRLGQVCDGILLFNIRFNFRNWVRLDVEVVLSTVNPGRYTRGWKGTKETTLAGIDENEMDTFHCCFMRLEPIFTINFHKIGVWIGQYLAPINIGQMKWILLFMIANGVVLNVCDSW